MIGPARGNISAPGQAESSETAVESAPMSLFKSIFASDEEDLGSSSEEEELEEKRPVTATSSLSNNDNNNRLASTAGQYAPPASRDRGDEAEVETVDSFLPPKQSFDVNIDRGKISYPLLQMTIIAIELVGM